MDFPAYVPAAVRVHISHYLEGEQDRAIPGYIQLLAGANSEVAKAEAAVSAHENRWGDSDLSKGPYLDGLRQKRAAAIEHRDIIARDVDCLQRLAREDLRMQAAFALLTKEFTDDSQWRNFVHSAWAARADFEKYRDRVKRAAELKGEIADAAEALATLIRKFSSTGLEGPDEFYSVPELLRQTDNHEMQGHNLHMWRAMRRHVLGDAPPADKVPDASPPTENASPPDIKIAFVEASESAKNDCQEASPNPPAQKGAIDSAEARRGMLLYAWQTAPDLTELLDTVAAAARKFKPAQYGMIGAAIELRQRSQKTEYLRAFRSLLVENHKLPLTPPVQQAMAGVASVLLDIDVSYDDVRKTLKPTMTDRS